MRKEGVSRSADHTKRRANSLAGSQTSSSLSPDLISASSLPPSLNTFSSLPDAPHSLLPQPNVCLYAHACVCVCVIFCKSVSNLRKGPDSSFCVLVYDNCCCVFSGRRQAHLMSGVGRDQSGSGFRFSGL